jgi:hypothetical protein
MCQFIIDINGIEYLCDESTGVKCLLLKTATRFNLKAA